MSLTAFELPGQNANQNVMQTFVGNISKTGECSKSIINIGSFELASVCFGCQGESCVEPGGPFDFSTSIKLSFLLFEHYGRCENRFGFTVLKICKSCSETAFPTVDLLCSRSVTSTNLFKLTSMFIPSYKF